MLMDGGATAVERRLDYELISATGRGQKAARLLLHHAHSRATPQAVPRIRGLDQAQATVVATPPRTSLRSRAAASALRRSGQRRSS
eukprot:SAG11_NODE_6157_length_1374_cov_7.632941_2_plen_85_part_01